MTLTRAAPVAVGLLLEFFASAVAQTPPQTPAQIPMQAPAQIPMQTPAQMPMQAPPQMPMQMPMQMPPQMPRQQSMPPCMADFIPLRTEAEKRAGAVKAAIDKKAPRPKICELIRAFAAAEAKVVKFVTDNQKLCNVPPQAITQAKANHEKTVKTRDGVCSAGPGMAGPIRPPGSGLGEALGTRTLPTPDTTSTGRGTLDTLTGNALAR
jgi:hypothetical protein